MTRRGFRLLGMALMSAVGALLVAGMAYGQTSAGIVVEVDGDGPVFDIRHLYPSAVQSSTVRVHNHRAEAGSLMVRSVNIVDEDVCSPTELRAGTSCGEGLGDLGMVLEFHIERLVEAEVVPVWSGSLYDLATGVDLEVGGLPPGAVGAYRFTVHFPTGSGNRTQADFLDFDLRFDLSSDATVLTGTETPRSSGASVLGRLAQTGAPLLLLVGLGTAAVVAGLVLIRRQVAESRGSG